MRMMRYHKLEGFDVGMLECHECGSMRYQIHEPDTDLKTLRCERCRSRACTFGPWTKLKTT